MMPIECEEQEKDKSSINTGQSNPVNTNTEGAIESVCINRVSILLNNNNNNK